MEQDAADLSIRDPGLGWSPRAHWTNGSSSDKKSLSGYEQPRFNSIRRLTATSSNIGPAKLMRGYSVSQGIRARHIGRRYRSGY